MGIFPMTCTFVVHFCTGDTWLVMVEQVLQSSMRFRLFEPHVKPQVLCGGVRGFDRGRGLLSGKVKVIGRGYAWELVKRMKDLDNQVGNRGLLCLFGSVV